MKLPSVVLPLLLCAESALTQPAMDTAFTRVVGPGCVLTKLVAPSVPMTAHVLQVDLTHPFLSLETVKAQNRLVGTERTSSMATRTSSDSHRVVAAVNGDYYSTTTPAGLPLSIQVHNGEILRTPSAHAVLGFDTANSAMIGIVGFAGSVEHATTIRSIDGINESRGANKLVLFNSYYGVSTGTDATGAEIMLRPTGNWTVNGEVLAVVENVLDGIGSSSLVPGKAVLSGTGTARDFLVAQLSSGDTVLITLTVSPALPNIKEMLGGWPKIVQNGLDYVDQGYADEGGPPGSGSDTQPNPRTAAGFSADGATLFLVAVDGRQPSLSVGMTVHELANFLIGLGVHTAINLDGGGSTTLVINDTVMNSPSDGTERAVGNSLTVVSKEISEAWVCPTGDCGHPGFDFDSIGKAVLFLEPGGTLHLAAAEFAETVVLAKDLVLTSSGAPTLLNLAVVGAAVTLGADVHITGTLTLIGSTIITGAHKIFVVNNAPGAVVLSGGAISGEIQRALADGSTEIYQFTDPHTTIRPDGFHTASAFSVRSFPGITPPFPPSLGATRRYYTMSPSGGSVTAALSLAYKHEELNSIPENDLRLFTSPDGATWVERGGTVDSANDCVQLGNVSEWSAWTIARSQLLAYMITVTTGANGTIAPPGPNVSVSPGGSQQFTMTPMAGYHVATMTIDGVRVNPASTYTFSGVATNHTIGATFAVDSYAITGPTEYDLDVDGNSVTDMKVNLAAKPAGDATISAIAYVTPPSGAPALPPNGLPFFLDVNSSLPDHAFISTARLDLDGIAGFGPSSVLAYYNEVTASWVLIDGTYLVSDPLFGGHPSFMFQTDRFGAFAFFTPPEAPSRLYGSTSPNVAAAGAIYPNNSWRPAGPPYGGSDDWSWSGSQVLSVYLVPQLGSHFGSADITLEWDAATMSLLGINFGAVGPANGLYGSGHSYSSTTIVTAPYGPGRIRIECTRDDNGNFSTVTGDFIAQVDFTLLKPGHSPVAIIGETFAVLANGSPPMAAYMIPMQAEVKTYLGDIASAGDLDSGDGKVDFEDLVAWSFSYWAGVPEYDGSAQYKAKYDFGPTVDNYIFSLPRHDGKIDFEDLLIFSISYGQTAERYLPKVIAAASEPLEISLGKPATRDTEVHIPVVLGGGATDVRGLTLEINGQFGSFLGAEKGDLLQNYETPTPLLYRVHGRSIYLDLAVMGLDAPAIDRPGEVAVLRFAGNAFVKLAAFEGRSSFNSPLEMKKVRGAGESEPTNFDLLQNYPNPFNPTTTIQYALPHCSRVALTVYNTLGQKVAELVNGDLDVGYHEVQFNASDLASGVYFYRLQADDFVRTRKLLLVR